MNEKQISDRRESLIRSAKHQQPAENTQAKRIFVRRNTTAAAMCHVYRSHVVPKTHPRTRTSAKIEICCQILQAAARAEQSAKAVCGDAH